MIVITATVLEECNKPPFGRELVVYVSSSSDEIYLPSPFCRYPYDGHLKSARVTEAVLSFVCGQFDGCGFDEN